MLITDGKKTLRVSEGTFEQLKHRNWRKVDEELKEMPLEIIDFMNVRKAPDLSAFKKPESELQDFKPPEPAKIKPPEPPIIPEVKEPAKPKRVTKRRRTKK